MWDDLENFKKDMSKAADICVTTHENAGFGDYVFDRKSKKAFSVCFLKQSRNFGVVSKFVPSFVCNRFFLYRSERYVHLDLSFLPTGVHLIDFGPLMGTRGAQVKVYDFNDSHVYCAVLENDRLQSCAYNESEVYEQYGDRIRVPRLVRRPEKFFYVRELVSGSQARGLKCHAIKDIFSDLLYFYNSEPTFDVDRESYVDLLFKKITESDTLVLDLAQWLRSLSLQSRDKYVRLVRAHGDFAEKNILVDRNAFFVIDWERVSHKSMTYDICNLYFKKFSSIGLSYKNNPLSNKCLWGIQNMISLNQVGVVVNSCASNYALFLLERLSYEVELHVGKPDRLNNFLSIYLRHINDLRGLVNS